MKVEKKLNLMRVAVIKNESRTNKIFIVECFFLRRNSSATNIPTERISGTQKSPLPTPSKKIGPAGQKKGNLLHVSSKFFQKITLKFWGRGEDHLKPKGGGSKQYQNNTYPLTFQYFGAMSRQSRRE